jgi:hypothetical protein
MTAGGVDASEPAFKTFVRGENGGRYLTVRWNDSVQGGDLNWSQKPTW